VILVPSSSTSGEVQVFRIKKAWRLFLGIFSPALTVLFGWFMALPFIEGRSNDFAFVAITLIIGGGGFSFFTYACLSLYNAKIELYPDKICDINLLRTRQLFLKDIEGFRILPTQYVKTLSIIPKDQSLKKLKIALVLEREAMLLGWITNTLINLDEAEFQAEAIQIESDSRLGETKEDRLWLVDKARKWAWLINTVCFVVTFWAMFKPRPYNLVILILLTCPLIALVSLRFFKGVLKVDGKQQSAYPTIAVALMMPGFGLGLRALDWNILAWEKFWVPFAMVTICLMVLTVIFTTYEKKTISYAAGLVFICPIYGAGVTVVLNGILDTSTPLEYKTSITDKWITSGKNRSYTFKTYTPDCDYHEIQIDVNKSTYERHKIGDDMKLIIRNGELGMPWCRLKENNSSP
jgi:hypothetical protein